MAAVQIHRMYVSLIDSVGVFIPYPRLVKDILRSVTSSRCSSYSREASSEPQCLIKYNLFLKNFIDSRPVV